MTAAMKIQLYIDGKGADGWGGRTMDCVNPATGEVIANVQVADDADIERAVVSAWKAQTVWSAMSATARGRILNRAVALLRDRNEDLARLETLDTGKPISETSSVDVATGADVLEYYAGLAVAIEGTQVPLREGSFFSTHAANPWASSRPSAPGTIRSRSRCGNRRRRLLPETPSSSSRAK